MAGGDNSNSGSVSVSSIGSARKPVWRDVVQNNILKNPEFMLRTGQARVAAGGTLLGAAFAFGLSMALLLPAVRTFGCYLALLAIFHLLEFFVTAVFQHRRLSFTSFLLNHSFEYNCALVASMVEYWVEWLFFPSLKESHALISLAGALITIAGQYVRTLAMYTAGSNFTHVIADVKHDSHQLVTDGIYAHSRHPSYAGWWWWCVGTQLLLCNPVCCLAYALVAWRFFATRVVYEEERLFAFFGRQYVEYHRRVGTGIPFLSTPCLEQLAALADEDRQLQEQKRREREEAKS